MIKFNRYNFLLFSIVFSSNSLAVDSYRYLHVTIDTPWAIFLFLLPIVLSPFIIMAIMYWRFAGRNLKPESPDELNEDGSSKKVNQKHVSEDKGEN